MAHQYQQLKSGKSELTQMLSVFPLHKRRIPVYVILLLISLLASVGAAHAEARLKAFKMVQQENVMLHFDLNTDSVIPDLFVLEKPSRLVIDMPQTTLATDLPDETYAQGVVKGIRYAQHGDAYLRVVLDLRRTIQPTLRMVKRQDGQRLIIDLGVRGNPDFQPSAQRQSPTLPPRDTVVAIDAGHGGKDPGAIGQMKTLEKDVTLAIAIRLHNRLLPMAGIKPVLIRKSDEFVELRKRIDLARQARADIFISIHADAINRPDAKGSSVYALSMDGATSEAAAWLAKSENRSAQLHGDLSLDGYEESLAQTLLSLTQNNSMERSMEVGAAVLSELKQIGNVHKQTVEQAAFAVLKSPDIPSILIETAFISNQDEEKKLQAAEYQEKLAQAIERGLIKYLQKRAPEGTLLARQRHSGNGS